MIEYEVEIAERPLGVRFAHADRGETVVVHLVLENKVGHKLGLLPGDILIGINGKSVLDISSSQALELFRSQSLPFKASFRRFEDDDDFDSDEEEEENSETDLRSNLNFQHENVNHIMHALSTQPTTTKAKHQKTKSIQLTDWSNQNVLEWLEKYGLSLGNKARFIKYKKTFIENKIDGKSLRKLDKKNLLKLGIDEKDSHDLYLGIMQLNSIVFAPPNVSNLGKQLEQQENNQQSSKKIDDDEKQNAEEEEEEDNWEAPFLPYMYDAPEIKLSEKTTVKVYSARVVAPYKKRAFALYEIEVCEGKEEWLLSKRYSEFYRLYEQMKKLGVHTKKVKFPRKGIFNKSTDKAVMEERKVKLTEYLNELLKEFPVARKSKELSDFLSPSRTFVVDE